jgi:tRNA modification GTPase
VGAEHVLPCLEDTIAAIASAPGGAARGIVRLSGPSVADCLRNVFRPVSELDRCGQKPQLLPGWITLQGPLGDIACHVLYWPTMRSYTRQPSAEIHLPGSVPILQAVLHAVCRYGARLAQPGEFTLRAFLAGRLDLAQAEAVLGVIEARNQHELALALRQLAGGIGSQLNTLRDHLLNLIADVEAGLDFADEDIRFVTHSEIAHQVQHALEQLRHVQYQFRDRTLVDGRYRVVLRGAPNAGKSSLFNALLERPLAIVSDRQGTTRDYLAADVTWHSLPIQLIDTAGVGEQPSQDTLEHRAQEKSQNHAETAHLELLCVDATQPREVQEAAALAPASQDRIVVWTKADLIANPILMQQREGILVSSRTGEGLQELKQLVVRRLSESATAELLPVTVARCRDALIGAEEALQNALTLAHAEESEELIATELRAALDALGQITGTVYTDDILDRIFSRFCIGK